MEFTRRGVWGCAYYELVHGQELDCDTDPVSRALRRRKNDKITPAMGTAKIIWRTKHGVSPACTPFIRQHYASNTPQYLVHPLYVGVIVLNGFYCSSRIICKQSVRHTIYIEAIFVIVPVVFTLISSLSTCEVGPFPAICSMNHTDEQDMLQEQDRLHLSSVNLTKAEDNRSCFC